MYYFKKIIIVTKNKDDTEIQSTLDLQPGLNIVYGPSQTGKSYVLECIDFLTGGKGSKLRESQFNIISISAVLDVDGSELTLKRFFADKQDKDIFVSGDVEGIKNGIYHVKNKTKKKDRISSVWFKLMGIEDEEVKIISTIENSTPCNMSIRTFCHMFLVNAGRMASDNSILKNGLAYTDNIPVPTITSLIYLLTGNNYINPERTNFAKGTEIKIRKDTAKKIYDDSIREIYNNNIYDQASENLDSAEEIHREIDQLLDDIVAAENSLNKVTEQDEEISHKIIDIDGKVAECKILQSRYDTLRTQYESDIRRLTFIAEADHLSDKMPVLDHCPFCNGELPKEKKQSCLEAAIEEVNKIDLRIKDLQSADSALKEELIVLQNKRDDLVLEQQQIQAMIRGELRPQVNALRDQIRKYTLALERAKANQMVMMFSEILNNRLYKIDEEERELEPDFDVRQKIRDVLQKPIEKHLDHILRECKFDNYIASRFDEDLCDVVVNGYSKRAQGQGYKAFLNSILAITLQEVMEEFNLYKTHLLVLDAPILSLKERGEDIGDVITSDSMRGALFQYLVNNETDRQTIIIENEIPDIDYSKANLIYFTQKEKVGRYGLITE